MGMVVLICYCTIFTATEFPNNSTRPTQYLTQRGMLGVCYGTKYYQCAGDVKKMFSDLS